jgi:hypothetical protein
MKDNRKTNRRIISSYTIAPEINIDQEPKSLDTVIKVPVQELDEVFILPQRIIPDVEPVEEIEEPEEVPEEETIEEDLVEEPFIDIPIVVEDIEDPILKPLDEPILRLTRNNEGVVIGIEVQCRCREKILIRLDF